MKNEPQVIVTKSGAIAEIKGYRYRLYNVEDNDFQVINFFNSENPDIQIGESSINGTTTEEVIRVLMDHLETTESVAPNSKKRIVRYKLKEILDWLDDT